MVSSNTVLAMQSLQKANLSALTFVNFELLKNFYQDYSHGQAVITYNKLNMSKIDECAEPYSKGCRTWLVWEMEKRILQRMKI